MYTVVIVLFTPMGVCILLIWLLSQTDVPRPSWTPLDHLLMEEPTVVCLALMSVCSTTLNDVQTLWE